MNKHILTRNSNAGDASEKFEQHLKYLLFKIGKEKLVSNVPTAVVRNTMNKS